jgi:hypothetical protein
MNKGKNEALAPNSSSFIVVPKLALTARNILLTHKFIGPSKKFAKNWKSPLFRPGTDHACHQKPNPSRETVSLDS